MTEAGGRDQLRRLAVWLAARREVDAAVAQLTRYGPAAAEQVDAHLVALTRLVSAEAEAFAAVTAAAAQVPQRPLPAGTPLRATVHSMDRARDRREQGDRREPV